MQEEVGGLQVRLNKTRKRSRWYVGGAIAATALLAGVIGLLGRGHYEEKITSLNEDHAVEISRRGDTISQKNVTIGDLSGKIETAETAENEASVAKARLEGKLSTLTNDYNSVTTERDGLRGDLSTANTRSGELETQLTSTERNYKRQLDAKDGLIEAKNNEIDAQKDLIEAKNNEIEILNDLRRKDDKEYREQIAQLQEGRQEEVVKPEEAAPEEEDFTYAKMLGRKPKPKPRERVIPEPEKDFTYAIMLGEK